MADELDRITATVRRVGKVEGLVPDDDIYDAGFSSINALELLLELEAEFEVSIPDDQFIGTRSVRSLGELIGHLKREQVV